MRVSIANKMADSNEPELATNEHWRGIMVRARKTHGLSQEALGARVGISQAMISKIESGESSASDRVLAICRVLAIPPPQHFEDDDAQSWSEIGRLLRLQNPERFKALLTLAEGMAADEAKKQQTSAEVTPAKSSGERPERK